MHGLMNQKEIYRAERKAGVGMYFIEAKSETKYVVLGYVEIKFL